jgi:transmembrane sensor
LEADPRNLAAFDAVDAVAVEVADHGPAAHEETCTAEAAAGRRPFWLAMSRRVRVWGALAAAVLIAVVLKPVLVDSPIVEAHATAIGERRDIQLSDGSTIYLNTDTAVSVSFTRGSRSARVEKGEALFEVAADTKRPFDVTVGDRHVRVVGTAFNILRQGGGLAVAVKHGIVQVRAEPDSGKGGALKLLAGDQYMGRDGSSEYKLAKIDPATVAAWQQGGLLFNDAPLSQVVADLNRYFRRPVVVQEADVGNLRFSGILKIDDQISMLRRLESFLPIAVQEGEDKVVLVRGSK